MQDLVRAKCLWGRPRLHKGENGTLCIDDSTGGGLSNFRDPPETAKLVGSISCCPLLPQTLACSCFPFLGSAIQILEVVNYPSGASNSPTQFRGGEHRTNPLGTFLPWPSDPHCCRHSQALALSQTCLEAMETRERTIQTRVLEVFSSK